MRKKYNTPHRSRVVKTRLSEDEYADFTARLAPYYYANTTKKWDDSRNYDMILDSAVLGTDTCVHVLKACLS